MRLTKQEMFNRAYVGLRSQDFEACKRIGRCAYSDGKGNHCAWGWVDTSLDDEAGPVNKVPGLAKGLGEKQMEFALELQAAHDNAEDPPDMKRRLHNLAKHYDLKIPRTKSPQGR